MPSENLEEQGLERNPNLHLAQLKFLLTLPKFKSDEQSEEKLLNGIKEDSKLYIIQFLVFLRFL